MKVTSEEKKSETVKRLSGTSDNELRGNANETLITDCWTVRRSALGRFS